MNDGPRYLVIGGDVFDRVATGQAEHQRRFLSILRELRRNPTTSSAVNIDPAIGWGVDSAYIADLEGLAVSYHVLDRFIVLIDVIWV